MKRPSIVVLGSSNTDMVVRVDRIPKPGETLLGGIFLTAAGGKGANQAVAAARAGGTVSFIGCIGRDAFGDAALAGFRRDGIRVDLVVRAASAPSGVALIFVARDGENSIAVAPGANSELKPVHVGKSAARIRSASLLVMQLETPMETIMAAADTAARAGVKVLLNPAPARKLPTALLKQVSLLTPNEHELELLTGIRVDGPRAAARAAARLQARGVRTVIVTLGARGAFICSPDKRCLVPGVRVKAVDTTAAGDVFNGALAVALAEGTALPDAVRFANAAAAISVTRVGAQPSAPNRREIVALLRSR